MVVALLWNKRHRRHECDWICLRLFLPFQSFALAGGWNKEQPRKFVFDSLMNRVLWLEIEVCLVRL